MGEDIPVTGWVKGAKRFRSKIWERKDHNKKSECINMETELQTLEEGLKVDIPHRRTQGDIWKNTKLENPWLRWHTRILVWKIYLHPRQKRIQKSDISDCMIKGKITLTQKDPLNGTVPNNYIPITCLPKMWKILTTKIRKEFYNSLISHGLFPRNRKDAARGPEAQENYYI